MVAGCDRPGLDAHAHWLLGKDNVLLFPCDADIWAEREIDEKAGAALLPLSQLWRPRKLDCPMNHEPRGSSPLSIS
jgi:hypothetical protein